MPQYLDVYKRQVWNRLTGHMPVYFESSLPDEVAQLLPSSGMTPDEYQAVQRYFGYGGEENFQSMLLHIAHHAFGADCDVPPPVPPVEEGFYTADGILSEEDALALRRYASVCGKPIVCLLYTSWNLISFSCLHLVMLLWIHCWRCTRIIRFGTPCGL